MARIVSFVVLVAILLLIGALFFRVMSDFILPLFLALLLVVIFGPMHRAIVVRARGHNRVAALASTTIILLTVLLPVAFVLVQAAVQAVGIVQQAQRVAKESMPDSSDPSAKADAAVESDKESPAEEQQLQFNPAGVARVVVDAAAKVGIQLSAEEVQHSMASRLQAWVGPIALGTSQWLLRLVFGFFIMAISVYYFLADGPEMLRAVTRLTPLDEKYEAQIIEQFTSLTRTIVLATLASALAQGLLAGVGYYFAGVGSVVLLTVLSTLLAMVPFLGAMVVWVPVCLYLYLGLDQPTAAIGLAIYATVIVSTVDNVIKPLILHGGANLHPLLALLSVIGGVSALGPIGLFIGPMVVAFLQPLLTMFNTELAAIGNSMNVNDKSSATAKKKGK